MKRFFIIFMCMLMGMSMVFAEGEISPLLNADDYIKPKLEGYSPYVLKKDEVLYSSSNYKINKFDPTVRTNYEGLDMPGARGTNQLIIYTSLSGATTGTNEYGNEAIVVGNTVVELSGANSAIPKDGFVISGHGRAKNWINSAIKVGTKIYVDSENMTVYTYETSESLIYFATKKLEETEQMIDYYASNSPNYDPRMANVYTDDAKKYIKKAKKNADMAKKYVPLAIEASNDALKCTIPFKSNEMKGVWIRPTERNATEVRATVQNLKRLGMNAVFLETFYHGKTIFPSETMAKYGFMMQNENFSGFDPLAVWSEECKKQRIKLHVWFETFYIGNDNPSSNPQHIMTLNPNWSNKNKKDYFSVLPSKVTTEHNGYFLDPANPEVRAFLLALMEEIIVKYNPGGINLDYIRYPNAVGEVNTWGYTSVARADFRARYGVDPVDINSTEMFTEWANFRRSYVTQMVEEVSKLCDKHSVYFSTVIFPDRLTAFTAKLQDWKTWSKKGYIDGVTPLFLTCDAKTVSENINKVRSTLQVRTDLFAGLFVTFIGGSSDDLIRQLHEARKLNIGGVVIFDYAHISAKYTDFIAMFFRSNVGGQMKKNDKNQVASQKDLKKKRKFF